MNSIYSLIAPIIMAFVGIYAYFRRVDIFSALIDGATDGLKTVGRILPPLICLLAAVHMLRASGALDAATKLFSPALEFFGIPAEVAPLMILRPISGSGALAVGSEIINEYGVDSLIGRTAAVMLGSTETTFYVIAVYFGAAGIKKAATLSPRHSWQTSLAS